MATPTVDDFECCEDYTPKTYLGMCREQQNETPSFARMRFTNRQINTERAYWDYMEEQAFTYYPQVMCDPCAKAPVMSVAEQFTRRYADPFTLKNRATVTCGEVKHQIFPTEGAGGDGQSTWLQQFRDYMARKTLLQSEGFDKFEEAIAWEFMITQEVNFPETEYLPDGLRIQYPRDKDLDRTTTECFGKGQDNSMGIIEDYLNFVDSYNDSINITDSFMHWETWKDLRQSDDWKECMKTYNPQLFVGNQIINLFNFEPVITPRGANLVYTAPDGHRFWTINYKKKYANAAGEKVSYDLMPKNKIISFDLSGSANQWAPEFIYTPIMDVFAALEEPEQINSARYAKTYTDKMNECWERRLTSNLMIALRCPNSSASLTLCVPAAAQAKTAAKGA